MIVNFQGGPVGLETLAAAIGEDSGTLEDVYEPYLLQNGFLNLSLIHIFDIVRDEEFETAVKEFAKTGQDSDAVSGLIAYTSVSYTHLDVYKRQLQTFCLQVYSAFS